MVEKTIRIVVAVGLSVALLGAGDAGPAAIGALYLAAVTAALVQHDLRELRLPDALVLPGAAFVVVGAVWSSLRAGGGQVAVAALVCGVAALVGFAVPASGGGLGMGDVKLAAVLAGALAALVAERGPPLGEVVTVVGCWAVLSFVAGAVVAWLAICGRGARRRVSAELPFGPVLLGTFWGFVLLG
ncbi:leader peptidase (prepilin peptidase)/N-methyltransferase [Leifsonia sp. EB41]|uniref:prepilin peptidase n=1 Tax=Leifsonia sp. EB41 TaxID=3156260 RepID=UPI0035182272